MAGWLITHLLDATDRILEFYKRFTGELTLDALLGAKICKDQLTVALQYTGGEMRGLSPAIRALIRKADDVIQTSLPHLSEKHPQDSIRIVGVLDIVFDWDELPKTLVVPPSSGVANAEDVECREPYWNETVSDECIANLLPNPQSSTSNSSCSVEDHCIESLLRRCHGYTLTHQLLYLLVGAKGGCQDQMEAKIGELSPSTDKETTMASLTARLCSDIYEESSLIARRGFPSDTRDIFIEQGVLCGMLGYSDFFNLDWLGVVLSWERGDGCFPADPGYMARHKMNNPGASTSGNHRQKRKESILQGYCSSHTMGVATSYFGVYVHHLLLLANV
ncbi:UPF0764 protein C16orf89 homolog [Diadema setosum]|uniref:UPF0764 protein C16orf89 homolog n=1 Tax=Diadema setosum TaxID=31175 RepID=UPI003B3B1678